MERVQLSKEEMERERVARFADMRPSVQGFLDTRMHAHAGALLAAPPGPAMASAAIASTRPAEAPRLRIEQTLCLDFAPNRQSLYACTFNYCHSPMAAGERKVCKEISKAH